MNAGSADGSAGIDPLRHRDVAGAAAEAAEPGLDELATLAARICGTPMAAIGLVDGGRPGLAAQIGLAAAGTTIDVARLLAQLLDRPGVCVVADLAEDPRLAGRRHETAGGRLRFLAGCPLVTPEGTVIGVLAVLDAVPRPDGLSDDQLASLELLGRQVIRLVEARRIGRGGDGSDGQFRVLTDAMPQMIWTTRPDGFHDFYNERWYEFTGVPRGSTDGEGWDDMFHAADRERAFAAWRRSLATGDLYEVEYRLRHHTGDYRWVLCRGTPLRGDDGRILRWIGTCTDIDAIKRTEVALAESEARFRTLIEVAPQVVWFAGPDGRLTYSSPHWFELTGMSPAQTLAEGWIGAVAPDGRDGVRAAWDKAVAEALPYELEIPFRHRDGEYRWFLVRAHPIREETGGDETGGDETGGKGAGRVIRWAGISLDIHERRRAEEAGDLLARELAHRIKNIFAVVGGLVSVSARGDPAVRPYADNLRQRLATLALAHEYVRPHSEALRPLPLAVTVQGLLSTLLGAYRDTEGWRVVLAGPDHPIGARAATALALIVHEHATNAMKYGALSVDEGRIAIETRLDGDALEIHWSEAGGPPVAGEPTRRGFGTLLAERSARGQLGGEMRHDWHPAGLRSVLRVPLHSLAD